MSDHRYRPQVEILSVTDTGRRRRWMDAEKVRIGEEGFGPRGGDGRIHGRAEAAQFHREIQDVDSGGNGPRR